MNNTITMKQTNKLIPDLRFPEFVKDGEWKEKIISEIGETINGLSGKSSDDFGEGSPYVTYKQVFDNSIVDFSKCAFVKILDNEKQNILKKGDVLFTTSSETPNEVGYASTILSSPTESTYLNSFCFAVRPFDVEEIKPEFSRYLFHSPLYRRKIGLLAQGSTRYNISKSAFIKLNLYFPKPNEQQKIADCLTSLDELITAHTDKLETLKNHKKGLLQNIFPQEGQKVPNYRFPEFVNDVKWEEKKLNVFLELLTDFEANGSFADVKSNVSIYDDRNYAWYVRSTDLGNKSSLETVKYVDETSYKFLKKTVLKGGELLITKRGEIGKVYIYESIENLPATLAPNLYLLKLNDKAKPIFFYYYFINNIGKQSLKRLNASSTIGALYKDDVKNINVVALNLKEQKKIAECLTEVDNLITAQSEKIEQLKIHKKGLMQGLFPKID